MKFNYSKKNFLGSINYFVISIFCLIFAIPFLWMVLSSFKPGIEIIQIPPTFFPENFTFMNYVKIFEQLNFFRLFFNSLVVSVIIAITSIFTSSIAGYVFSKFNFRWKNIIFIISISGMMIPFASIILPIYLFISKLGLSNSYIGLALPFIISPFGIFLMRQFTEGIPIDLIEAARIDGASEIRIYFQIIAPLTTAAMAAVGIFNFLYSWNQLWWPLMIVSNKNMYTLPLGIVALAHQFGKRFDMVVTGATLAVLPIMIVFALAQRQMVKGVTVTGMKL